MSQFDLIYWSLLTGGLSALATGLGAIPVHFLKRDSKTLRCFASAAAAGMMTSASVFSLVQEGINLQNKIPCSPYVVILGLMLGAFFMRSTEERFNGPSTHKHYLKNGWTKRSALIFLAMFIHSIPEGIAIGVAFATQNLEFGLIMAIAIAVHNIPEGMATSLPLKADGISTPKCAWISILTSLPQPIMAVPAALLAWFFEPLLPIGLGFAGGAMVYLVIAELVPEALKEGGKNLTAFSFMIGLSGMLLITTLLKLIKIH